MRTKLEKKKFIIFIRPRERESPHIPCRATEEAPGFGQVAKDRSERESLG